MCNPFFPMLNPSDPPPGFPRHNTPSQQYFPLLPGPPQAAAPQPPPPPAPARPTQGAAYMQPGPHAKLGFFIDTQNTETPDREMAQELGQRFGCHTCGGQPCAKANTSLLTISRPAIFIPGKPSINRNNSSMNLIMAAKGFRQPIPIWQTLWAQLPDPLLLASINSFILNVLTAAINRAVLQEVISGSFKAVSV